MKRQHNIFLQQVLRCLSVYQILVLCSVIFFLSGCATGPQITGYAVNTPKYYSENKVFLVKGLADDSRYTAEELEFLHLYQVNPTGKEKDIIEHNDPVSVILQGVRVPEDLPDGRRDIAVILDIVTSSELGTVSLLAFYQRDVPAGQMLNFNNLLVYSDPMWDSANPPYFRLRVMDVKAERNRNTEAVLSKVSNLSSKIGGMVPHPVIPMVTTAIDAANIVLSNQKNIVLLDYQIQFYSQQQTDAASSATLGPLMAGQWVVLGRGKDADSSFWKQSFYLERRTDRILIKDQQENLEDVKVPYISVVLMKADAQVPKLVMDRSESLLALLSSPSGKSDIDQMEQFSSNLSSAIRGFISERRLRKYRSKAELGEMIRQLDTLEDDALRANEFRRLIYILNSLTENKLNYTDADKWVKWWEGNNENGHLESDSKTPLGIKWVNNE